MKGNLLYLVMFMFTFIGLTGCTETAEDLTYKNPIGEITDIGDPFILKHDDTYYMYATSIAGSGFLVWQSDNLVDWDAGNIAYTHNQQSVQWATGDFWAPEVVYHDGLFIMIYSARDRSGSLKITLATSEDPAGPFIDKTIDIVGGEGSFIDGHIFIDDDNDAFLYYVKDNYENVIDGNHISQIFVQEMTDDLLNIKGESTLLLQPDQPWENPTEDYQWNEGPFVLKNDNKYYLMYSANFYASEDYSVGYAVSESSLGPYEKSENNPILSKDLDKGVSGPGHNSVTLGLDDETLYAVYHIHSDPDNPSGNRKPAIDRLYFENGELKIEGPSTERKTLY